MHPSTSPPAPARRPLPSQRPRTTRRRPGPTPPPDGPWLAGRGPVDWANVPAFGPPETDDTPTGPGMEPPALAAPLAGAVVDVAAVTLSWSAGDALRQFDVELSPEPDFAATVLRLHTGASTELYLSGVPLPEGARLFWRVRSAGNGGVSPWSEPASFYTGSPADVDAQEMRLSLPRRSSSGDAHTAPPAGRDDELVPPYLRESSITTALQATIVAVILMGAALAFLIGVLVGALAS